VKFVYLFCFILNKFVTMHGHTNVEFSSRSRMELVLLENCTFV